MFVTLDGLDGSGKTSSIERLVRSCGIMGIKATSVVEPGTTVLGKYLREFHLKHSEKVSPKSQVHMMMAARAANAEHIKALLKEYQVVFVDRWLHSTFVYQYLLHQDYWSTRGGVDALDWIMELHENAVEGLTPDFSYYLNIPHTERRKRLESRGEVYGLDRLTFTEKLDSEAQAVADMLGMVTYKDNDEFLSDVNVGILREVIK